MKTRDGKKTEKTGFMEILKQILTPSTIACIISLAVADTGNGGKQRVSLIFDHRADAIVVELADTYV